MSIWQIKRISQSSYKSYVLGSQRHSTGVNGRTIGGVQITRSMSLGCLLQRSQTLFGETFNSGGTVPSQPSRHVDKRRTQHEQREGTLSTKNISQSLHTRFEARLNPRCSFCSGHISTVINYSTTSDSLHDVCSTYSLTFRMVRQYLRLP